MNTEPANVPIATTIMTSIYGNNFVGWALNIIKTIVSPENLLARYVGEF